MKNLNLLFAFFFIFSSSFFAQDNRKFEFSVDYSIGQSYRTIEASEQQQILNDLYKPVLTHGVDLRVRYKISNKLGLITGVGYQQYGEQFNSGNLVNNGGLSFGDQIDPRHGFIYDVTELPISRKIKNIYSYIELPFLLNYLILDKGNNKFDVSLGGAANYLVSARTITINEFENSKDERSSKNTGFSTNDISFGGQLAISYQRKIKDSIFIQFGPRFDYFFTSIYDDMTYDYFPYKTSLVLAVGF